MKPIAEMTGPELVEAFNQLAKEKGYQPTKRFSTMEVGRKRLTEIMAIKSALPEAAKEAPKPAVKEKKAKKAGGWQAKRIFVLKEGNPRREGTKAYTFYNDMLHFLSQNSVNTTAGDVINNTEYRPQDLRWDVAHGHIELKD